MGVVVYNGTSEDVRVLARPETSLSLVSGDGGGINWCCWCCFWNCLNAEGQDER